MNKRDKQYIGDGVYARVDEYGALVLTTENGICATNTIILEPEIVRNLEAFIKVARHG